MLARDLPQVAKVNIYVPNNLHSELLSFLFVVDGGAPDDAVELLHEEAPVASLEHREARIVETLSHCLGRLLLELNQKVCLKLVEIFNLVEVVILRFYLWGVFRSLEGPFKAFDLRRSLLPLVWRENADVKINDARINHHSL